MPTQSPALEKSIELPVSQAKAFQYHARPGALQRLTPPWEKVNVVHSSNSIEPGSEVLLRAKILCFTKDWLARHIAFEPPIMFSDRQVYGPFKSWLHEHCFESIDDHSCHLIDRVQYELPFGAIGKCVGQRWIKMKLDAMFEYRHQVTLGDLEFGKRISNVDLTKAKDGAFKTIAVSGSNGLIGKQIVALLSVLGHRVIKLERKLQPDTNSASNATISIWDPEKGLSNPKDLNGIDAVIHLAGVGIADRRWTDQVKKEIWSSRVDATTVLVNQLRVLPNPPKAFVSASGVGIYGNQADLIQDESQMAADDFLGRLAEAWEKASHTLRDGGTRVAHGRLGIVVSPSGGALAKMLPLFQLGLGGVIGPGDQYWSWISILDAVDAFVWLALNRHCEGAYNFSAGAVTNQEFTKSLASVLCRPAFFPVPSIILRTVLGEMADSMLLASTRAQSDRLLQTGFVFRNLTLESCLRAVLGK